MTLQHGVPIPCALVSLDGKTPASGSNDSTARPWRAAAKEDLPGDESLRRRAHHGPLGHLTSESRRESVACSGPGRNRAGFRLG